MGREIRLSTGNATVIGIARPEFDFPRDAAIWAPLHVTWPDVAKSADLGVFRTVARIAPGRSVAGAQTGATLLLRQSDSTRPAGSPRLNALVLPVLDEIYGSARLAVMVLMGAVLLVLLVACANAANLMLARFAERDREIAIRAALGAGRWRLVRLLLAESAAVAVTAGAAGFLLASVALPALGRWAPPEMPGADRLVVNWPVLAFGALLTAVTVLLFGAGPALIAVAGTGSALQGARTTGDRRQVRLRGLLICGEVALSVLLVVAGGLLVRSFAKLSVVDPGFHAGGVLTFRLTTELPDQESRRALYGQVLERVRALPGVEAAGAVFDPALVRFGRLGHYVRGGGARRSRAQNKPKRELRGHQSGLFPDHGNPADCRTRFWFCRHAPVGRGRHCE